MKEAVDEEGICHLKFRGVVKLHTTQNFFSSHFEIMTQDNSALKLTVIMATEDV